MAQRAGLAAAGPRDDAHKALRRRDGLKLGLVHKVRKAARKGAGLARTCPCHHSDASFCRGDSLQLGTVESFKYVHVFPQKAARANVRVYYIIKGCPAAAFFRSATF